MQYRKLFLFIGFIVIAASANSQYRTRIDSVSALKNIITRGNTVSGSAVGFAGSPSAAWTSFAYLTSIADNKQLVAMTKHSNPALRVYAYTALLHRKYADIEDIRKRLSSDEAVVQTLSGCIMSRGTVAEAIANTGHWYSEQGVTEFIKTIGGNKKYRSEVFSALVTNKPLKRLQD